MKTKSNFLLLATLIGGILFTLLFWAHWLGLNLLIYSMFIVLVTYFNDEVLKSKKLHLYALAHALAAALVVINNSDLALASYYISLMAFIGFAHYQTIRSVWFAFLATALQIITIPASLIKRLSELKIGNYSFKPIFRPIKYIILPLLIVLIFTRIYSGANEVFGHYLSTAFDGILTSLGQFFGFIFNDLSLERFIHFCFGTALTGGLIITFYNKIVEHAEGALAETLARKRQKGSLKILWDDVAKVFIGQMIAKKLALKTEYIIALISFIALNLLIFFLNGIDVWLLWLGKGKNLVGKNYSAEVHDGTNALIFSIFLAMAVIVYFFRGNLNFYSRNKSLKTLAFIWMIQNLVLIISVFIRDAQYIEVYGLTYKRIGVAVFATLCIIGLASVYIKVARHKTFFYLMRLNGNIWFVLLLAFATINWDLLIVRYNLAHSNTTSLDVDYLLSLSDKTLPVLDQNRKKIATSNDLNEKSVEIPLENTQPFHLKRLDKRIGYFKEGYQGVSWLSWNLQDWNTAHYFGLEK